MADKELVQELFDKQHKATGWTRTNYNAARAAADSPFAEHIRDKKLTSQTQGGANRIADTGKSFWQRNSPRETSIGNLGWRVDEKKLDNARMLFGDKKREFIKKGERLVNELAAEKFVGSADNMKTLADKLVDFHDRFKAAKKEYGGFKPGRTTFEAADEYFKLKPLEKQLVNKIHALKSDGISKSVRDDLYAALNKGKIYTSDMAKLAETPVPSRAKHIETLSGRIESLITEYTPKLEKLAEDANSRFAAVTAKGKIVPAGKVSAQQVVGKISRAATELGKAGDLAGIVAAAGLTKEVSKGMAEEVEATASTAKGLFGKMTNGLKKAAGLGAEKAEATLKQAEAVAEKAAEAAEGMLEGQKRTIPAKLFAKTEAQNAEGFMEKIYTLKQARQLKDGIAYGKSAMVVGSTALATSYLMGIGPFAKREEPKMKKIAATPPAQVAAQQM